MLDDIQFRHGTYRDAAAFAKLDQTCFPPETAFHINIFRYHLRDPNSINIAAVNSADEIAGFAVVKIYYSGETNLVTLDVAPNYRRRGIGAQLLYRLEKELFEKKVELIALQVAVDNEPAIELYKKSNYLIDSIIEGYYHDAKSAGGRDAYLMYKLL